MQQSPRNHNVWLRIGVSISVIILTMLTAALTSWLILQAGYKPTKSPQIDGNTRLSDEEVDLAKVVSNVSPGIVSIITANSVSESAEQSAGTGMILSADGYVLTNKHVINNAESVVIITSDGERYSDISLIGVDPLNDVAFLKIKNAKNLPTVALGNSSTIKVGQKVIAIGNSLGQYQNTVTTGIISGKGRPVDAVGDEEADIESLTDLLQTDAAINPGNSGGPLLNSSGQVIGINTAIASDAQNIGFAIPIDAVKGMTKGVLEHGRVEKAYIGVRYVAVTPDVRAKYNLPIKTGAYIGGYSGSIIEKDGPSDKAGLKKGDVIIKVNDKTVGDGGGLSTLVSEFPPGEQITLTVLREKSELKLQLTLGSYKAQH